MKILRHIRAQVTFELEPLKKTKIQRRNGFSPTILSVINLCQIPNIVENSIS